MSHLSRGCQAQGQIRRLCHETRIPQHVSLFEMGWLVQEVAGDERATGYGILIEIVMISVTAMKEAMKNNGFQKRAVMLNGTMAMSRGADGDFLLGAPRVTKPSDPVSLPEVGPNQRCLKIVSGHRWAPWLNSVSSYCKKELSVSGLNANGLSGRVSLHVLLPLQLLVAGLSAHLHQVLPPHLLVVVNTVLAGTIRTLEVCHLATTAAMALMRLVYG